MADVQMAPVAKHDAKTGSAPAKQKRRIPPNVDKMASLFIASYNKRRPATSDLGETKEGKVDVAGLAQARRFEWVGEHIAEERVDDAVRQYFGAVLLDGVQHAVRLRNFTPSISHNCGRAYGVIAADGSRNSHFRSHMRRCNG